MSWIFVIEKDEAHAREIAEAVAQMEPTVATLRFLDPKAFLEWMTRLEQNDPQLNPPLPSGKFRGIVTSVENWKFRDVKLIGKFKALFIQKGLAQSEDELGVVFTGYEEESVHKKRYEQRSVNNFIYKPFDKVLLRQLLEIAFSGRGPVKNFYVHNYKGSFRVEMLKEILSTRLTELGFHTLSDQAVQTGTIAKYYAPFLETQQHRSAMAQALSSQLNPKTGLHDVYLRFYALDQQQSFNLQRLVKEKSHPRTLPTVAGSPKTFEFAFVEHEKSSLCQEIEPTFERFFQVPIRKTKDLPTMLKDLQALSSHPDHRFVFIDDLHVVGNEMNELQSFINMNQKSPMSIFLLSKKIFPEDLERELSTICEDIYYSPFNKSYLMKSLKLRWPTIPVKEELFESTREFEQQIHVSNPVQIIEVSEVSVVIEYYRELPLSSFREFVFWMPEEAQTPTLLAQCVHTAPLQGKKGYQCHFIFFGLQDAERKHLRLWMRHQYVEEKQKGS